MQCYALTERIFSLTAAKHDLEHKNTFLAKLSAKVPRHALSNPLEQPAQVMSNTTPPNSGCLQTQCNL